MAAPIRKLREVRAEGVAILDELVRAKDAEASRAVATERAWLPKLLAALVPQGEVVQARFEPIGVTDRDEEAFASRHLSEATLADDDHRDSLYCHAVRMFRLDRLWKRIENATPVNSPRTVPSRDDGVGKRIQAVLEAAATKKIQNPHLSMAGIAYRMAKRDTIEKFDGYGYEAIRKILSGTFGPAKKRGIRGLGA